MKLSEKKKIIYPIILSANVLRHLFKKIKLPFFEIWVGQVCDLECMHCCHLIPYVKNKLYDIDKVISDIDKILKICTIEYFSIAGGEPFCHPQLYRLIDYAAKNSQINDGKIITNGTIIPNKRTLEALKAVNNKLEVRIDQYPSHSDEAQRFYELMRKNNIKCYINRPDNKDDSRWKMVGGPIQDKLNERITQLLYSDCFVGGCYTLADGELSACPRGITSEAVYGIEKNKYENVKLSELGEGVLAKAKIATCFSRAIYKDYCRYCLSLSEMNPYDEEPGKQLTDEVKNILRLAKKGIEYEAEKQTNKNQRDY